MNDEQVNNLNGKGRSLFQGSLQSFAREDKVASTSTDLEADTRTFLVQYVLYTYFCAFLLLFPGNSTSYFLSPL